MIRSGGEKSDSRPLDVPRTTAERSAAAGREARKTSGLGDRAFGLVLLSPALALVLAVAAYPVARVIWQSFFAQNLGTGLQPRFAGLVNYVRVMNDGRFLQTVKTTVFFTAVAVGVELVLGLAFALLLNRDFVGRAVARASALVPWALPTATLGLAWVWIFNDQFGVFNDLLRRLGLISHPVVWLGSAPTALFSLVFADVWKTTPFMTILLLAGLQNIPPELYEATQIDGARPWRSFRSITLPLLSRPILLAVLFRTIQSLGIFDLVYMMTGGGPGGSTETVSVYTYNTYMRYLDFGYGSAMLVVTFCIMAILAGVIYWPLHRGRGEG